jgi:hypothetical protein
LQGSRIQRLLCAAVKNKSRPGEAPAELKI